MLSIRRLLLRDLLTLVGATVGVLCLVFSLGTLQLLERHGDQRARELVSSLGEDLQSGCWAWRLGTGGTPASSTWNVRSRWTP